jgi:4-hydroxy-3-methylbut-2-en-1-yl diphosphate reductase
VENAIEISYKALEENPNKRVFLLSQMIHNQAVNEDLQQRGIRFIMDTDGTQFVPWEEISSEDIVIIPAFGTTIETEKILEQRGIEVQRYNTTCPFVEKVWKRSAQLGDTQHTVIIHGKHKHEETRATFSHSTQNAPSVIVRDMEEAQRLGRYITGEAQPHEFAVEFAGKYSTGFDPLHDLQKVGVVNQTTMLATETQAIADYFRQLMMDTYGDSHYKLHFADTRDTLCYATNDNQDATYGLLEQAADLAIVVGGYNSSNTSHIVELCERKFPTYYINSENEILSGEEIRHYNYPAKRMERTSSYIPDKHPVDVVLTSGASCPDTLVDAVLLRMVSFFPEARTVEEVLKDFEK